MKILRNLDEPELSFSNSVVTMGNFDGIHLGHQALVRNAVDEAGRIGYPSVVFTFEPHPLKILAPARAPRLLLTLEDKLRLLQVFGVDVVVAQKFDRDFSSILAEDFVRRYIAGKLRAKKMWVGRDLRFGRGRAGTADDLLRWGGELGFEVGIVEPILLGGVRISSTKIRHLIEKGRVDEVKPMLGRYHFVSGTIVAGNKRGRTLGFPTANVASRTEVIPADGIYATIFEIGEKSWASVTSIGVNPTFGDGPRTIEAFILDYDREIYGQAVRVSFVRRIRDQKKFTSGQALVAQMKDDVLEVRKTLAPLRLTELTGG